jgi:hypothetical protein
MADKNSEKGNVALWVIVAVLAALFAEAQYGVFSGCDRACQDKSVKAEVERCKQLIARMTDEELDEALRQTQEGWPACW